MGRQTYKLTDVMFADALAWQSAGDSYQTIVNKLKDKWGITVTKMAIQKKVINYQGSKNAHKTRQELIEKADYFIGWNGIDHKNIDYKDELLQTFTACREAANWFHYRAKEAIRIGEYQEATGWLGLLDKYANTIGKLALVVNTVSAENTIASLEPVIFNFPEHREPPEEEA